MGDTGFEPVTFTVSKYCSTPELIARYPLKNHHPAVLTRQKEGAEAPCEQYRESPPTVNSNANDTHWGNTVVGKT